MKFKFAENYTDIHKYFGLDISLFYQHNLIKAVTAVISYLLLMPVGVLDLYQDYAESQIYPLTRSLEYRPLRGVFTVFVLLFVCCVNSFQRKAKLVQYNDSGQYFLLLSNLQKGVFRQEVDDAMTQLAGDKAVTSVYMFSNLSSQYLKEQLFTAQKEYYDRLTESSMNLKPRASSTWAKLHMLGLVQALGFQRDCEYYKRKIDALEKKVRETNVEHFDTQDAAIVGFADAGAMQKVLHKGGSLLGIRLKKQRVRVQAAPSPSDIIYSGLCCNHWRRACKQLLTIVIILAISALNFLILCLLREFVYHQQLRAKSYIDSQLAYWGIFVVMLLVDLIFRPVIYWAVSFEQHISKGRRESSWMVRLYIYQLLTKFSVIFSRPVVNVIKSKKEDWLKQFISVFSFTTVWRRGSNTGGSDLTSILYTCIFGYPIMELIYPLLYKGYYKCAAVTQYDQKLAKIGCDIRYSSVYVSILVIETIVYAFCSFLPEILLLFAAFLLVYSLTLRLIQSLMCSDPIHIENANQTANNLNLLGLHVSVLVLSLSYQQWYVWLLFGVISIDVLIVCLKLIEKCGIVPVDDISYNSAIEFEYTVPQSPYTKVQMQALEAQYLAHHSVGDVQVSFQ